MARRGPGEGTSGASRADIIAAYPHLTEEDVQQAVAYASRFLNNEVILDRVRPANVL